MSKTHILAAFCLAVLSLPFAGLSQSNSQSNSLELTISVDGPRPLAAAAVELQKLIGVAVNFEDAPVLYSGDIADVTSSVMTKEQAAANPSARIFVPRGGSLLWTSQKPIVLSGLAVEGLVNSLVAANNAKDYTSHFKSISNAGTYFIVPTLSHISASALVSVKPILDTPVTVPAGKRNAGDAINLILDQLNSKGGSAIQLGMAPFGALATTSVDIAADNEAARNVLARLLLLLGSTTMADGSATSLFGYSLLSDPVSHNSAFSIHRVFAASRNPGSEATDAPRAGGNPYSRVD